MDGIFGGKNMIVNTRDFQWKTFTPMQLNMDGWGSNEKYPHALGEPATSINRWYLKLKSELLPYTYSFGKRGCNRYAAYPCHVPGISECLHLGNSYAVSVYVWYRFLVAPILQSYQSRC